MPGVVRGSHRACVKDACFPRCLPFNVFSAAILVIALLIARFIEGADIPVHLASSSRAARFALKCPRRDILGDVVC